VTEEEKTTEEIAAGAAAKAATEAGEALGQMIGDLFAEITKVLKSQESMREVQNVLILRLGEAVVRLLYKNGMFIDAKKLADSFGMAAAVLNASTVLLHEEEE